MMFVPLMLMLIGLGEPASQPGPLNAERFKELMKTAHANLQDYELICEGRIEFLDTMDPDHDMKVARTDRFTQAVFAYRASDGASYLDVYEKPLHKERAFMRTTLALMRGELSSIERMPDSPFPDPSPGVDIGGPGSLALEGSPERFNEVFYFQQLIQLPAPIRFTDNGWDEIDGHRCLRVTIEPFPGIDAWEFWIDLDRGGHVLRADFHRDGLHWLRIHSVRLERFDLPRGGSIWFPVHGVRDTFLNGYDDRDYPVLRETYDVVQGTLALNRGLRDERFSVDWDGSQPRTEKLQETRKEFRAAQAKRKPAKTPYMSPAEVEKDLNNRLEVAKRQADQLDASSPASAAWNRQVWLQAGLTTLGVAAIVAAVVLRRRA